VAESTQGDADELAGKAGEGAKSAISGVWEKGVAELKAVVKKGMTLPGVESVLKPAVTELMDKLGGIAGKKV